MSEPPLFAWKFILASKGFVAVAIAASAAEARCILKARLLLDEAHTDAEIERLFLIIDSADVVRIDTDRPSFVCLATV